MDGCLGKQVGKVDRQMGEKVVGKRGTVGERKKEGTGMQQVWK